MALIVQKYGGSSLVDSAAVLRVAGRVAETRRGGDSVVAVVSAMGKTTDDLIGLAQRVSAEPDPRELDVLLSTGELQSCALVAMALRALGHDAVSLNGAQAGIRTDTRYGNARIAVIEPGRVTRELESGRIVIVAGFQGSTEEMDVTTLGRGASDLSAVALAARLGADRCDVYTDVEGIYTADPNLVPEARRLDEIGFEEMLELASHGAKMNPRSIEFAMVYNVPIRVASSFVDGPGTLIHQEANMQPQIGEIRERVRGIATETGVAMIGVRGLRDRPGIAARIFGPLADSDLSVDVIVQNAGADGFTNIGFTVAAKDLGRATEVAEEAARELGARGVVTNDGLAKVSIVGTGMQDEPGYAGRMFRALADASVNIEMVSTSEIRITCVVAEEQLSEAARVLHTAFELDRRE